MPHSQSLHMYRQHNLSDNYLQLSFLLSCCHHSHSDNCSLLHYYNMSHPYTDSDLYSYYYSYYIQLYNIRCLLYCMHLHQQRYISYDLYMHYNLMYFHNLLYVLLCMYPPNKWFESHCLQFLYTYHQQHLSCIHLLLSSRQSCRHHNHSDS